MYFVFFARERFFLSRDTRERESWRMLVRRRRSTSRAAAPTLLSTTSAAKRGRRHRSHSSWAAPAVHSVSAMRTAAALWASSAAAASLGRRRVAAPVGATRAPPFRAHTPERDAQSLERTRVAQWRRSQRRRARQRVLSRRRLKERAKAIGLRLLLALHIHPNISARRAKCVQMRSATNDNLIQRIRLMEEYCINLPVCRSWLYKR